MSRRALIARDPTTYRRQELELSAAWDETTEPEVLGHYLANLVNTLARRWRELYGIPIPLGRIVWTVEEVADA